MKELIEAVGDASIPAFLMSLLIFGFAPGFVLRLIVLLYPACDPRRRELVAELYIMRRLERPVWVFEQIETVLFEGPAARWRRRQRGVRQRVYRLSTIALTLMIAITGFIGYRSSIVPNQAILIYGTTTIVNISGPIMPATVNPAPRANGLAEALGSGTGAKEHIDLTFGVGWFAASWLLLAILALVGFLRRPPSPEPSTPD